MRFCWDHKKAAANKRKHGVTFEEAASVFYDPLAMLGPDPDHSRNEDRLIMIGQSRQQRLLFVVHSYAEDAELIRIISARRATAKERRAFECL